jgi:hypothetical protein
MGNNDAKNDYYNEWNEALRNLKEIRVEIMPEGNIYDRRKLES